MLVALVPMYNRQTVHQQPLEWYKNLEVFLPKTCCLRCDLVKKNKPTQTCTIQWSPHLFALQFVQLANSHYTSVIDFFFSWQLVSFAHHTTITTRSIISFNVSISKRANFGHANAPSTNTWLQHCHFAFPHGRHRGKSRFPSLPFKFESIEARTKTQSPKHCGRWNFQWSSTKPNECCPFSTRSSSSCTFHKWDFCTNQKATRRQHPCATCFIGKCHDKQRWRFVVAPRRWAAWYDWIFGPKSATPGML